MYWARTLRKSGRRSSLAYFLIQRKDSGRRWASISLIGWRLMNFQKRSLGQRWCSNVELTLTYTSADGRLASLCCSDTTRPSGQQIDAPSKAEGGRRNVTQFLRLQDPSSM